MVIPARITPWPPNPPTCISTADMVFHHASGVVRIERARHLLVHQVEERGPLDIHEFSHYDGPLEPDAHFSRGRSVLHQAGFLEILHHVQAIADFVAALVERGALADD